MTLYLPDFDRPLHEVYPYEVIPLRDQLVFPTIVGDVIYISAASPFKNLAGWSIIRSYMPLLDEGIIRFPLDKRHQGAIDRYIQYRKQRIASATEDVASNPEYSAYTGREAENILRRISQSDFTIERILDCDALFRQLVADDAKSDDVGSIRSILHSKPVGFDKDEFLSFVREVAAARNQLFQRFHIVDNAPKDFVIDGVMRERLYRRLDALFFAANARAAGLSGMHGDIPFRNTFANCFRVFSQCYSVHGVALYDRITSLDAAALLTLRRTGEMKELLTEFRSRLDATQDMIATSKELSQMWLRADKTGRYTKPLLSSIRKFAISEVLGTLACQILGWESKAVTAPISILVSLLPWVRRTIKKTPAGEVYEMLRKYPVRL